MPLPFIFGTYFRREDMLSPSLSTSHKTRSHQVNVLMGHPGKGEPLSWVAVLGLHWPLYQRAALQIEPRTIQELFRGQDV